MDTSRITALASSPGSTRLLAEVERIKANRRARLQFSESLQQERKQSLPSSFPVTSSVREQSRASPITTQTVVQQSVSQPSSVNPAPVFQPIQTPAVSGYNYQYQQQHAPSTLNLAQPSVAMLEQLQLTKPDRDRAAEHRITADRINLFKFSPSLGETLKDRLGSSQLERSTSSTTFPRPSYSAPASPTSPNNVSMSNGHNPLNQSTYTAPVSSQHFPHSLHYVPMYPQPQVVQQPTAVPQHSLSSSFSGYSSLPLSSAAQSQFQPPYAPAIPPPSIRPRPTLLQQQYPPQQPVPQSVYTSYAPTQIASSLSAPVMNGGYSTAPSGAVTYTHSQSTVPQPQPQVLTPSPIQPAPQSASLFSHPPQYFPSSAPVGVQSTFRSHQLVAPPSQETIRAAMQTVSLDKLSSHPAPAVTQPQASGGNTSLRRSGSGLSSPAPLSSSTQPIPPPSPTLSATQPVARPRTPSSFFGSTPEAQSTQPQRSSMTMSQSSVATLLQTAQSRASLPRLSSQHAFDSQQSLAVHELYASRTLAALKAGTTMLVLAPKGSPQSKFVQVSADERNVVIYILGKKDEMTVDASMKLADIDVTRIQTPSAQLAKSLTKAEMKDSVFGISAPLGLFEIAANDTEQRSEWIEGLRKLKAKARGFPA